jgi:hypothetical protein
MCNAWHIILSLWLFVPSIYKILWSMKKLWTGHKIYPAIDYVNLWRKLWTGHVIYHQIDNVDLEWASATLTLEVGVWFCGWHIVLLQQTFVPSYFRFLLINDKVKDLTWKCDGRTDRRTYSQNGTYVTFPLIFLAIFSHTRLKKRHTSKNEMNRIKENLLLPIVLQVTQVPLGSYGPGFFSRILGTWPIPMELGISVMFLNFAVIKWMQTPRVSLSRTTSSYI